MLLKILIVFFAKQCLLRTYILKLFFRFKFSCDILYFSASLNGHNRAFPLISTLVYLEVEAERKIVVGYHEEHKLVSARTYGIEAMQT